ncbi:MFS transporter [Streptomyces yaizuensis]|uniref:MFS transporter n=1 Tax=Streptomyces yaizuensis TaxID=2989713 RepID=A0ABQ5P5U3_9ACTN|nr:MFS transporter [Streptomyces sp. YSPA8]GLF97823.1 MFS transporter [Streptomyces sp. YSPA8]
MDTHAHQPTAGRDPRRQTAPVGRGWTARLMLLHLGLYMALLTPMQILLAAHLAEIDPGGKEIALGWATGLGALVAVAAAPFAGALSDRTGGRFGRRRPWIAGGALVGACGLLLTAAQSTTAGVTLGWALAQLGLSAQLAGALAAVPDRVPVERRAAVSGSVAVPQALGLVVGAVLVTVVASGTGGGYALLAAVVVFCALPFVLVPEEPVRAAPRPRPRAGDFWLSPRAHPDYAWAWATRFLVNLGNGLGTLYLLYFLKDAVGYGDPERGVLVLTVLYTTGVVVTASAAGAVSDRLGLRRAPVSAGAVLMSAASLVLAVWPGWATATVAAALLGLGFGVYVSAEQALLTQVLPHSGDHAKDLGMFNAANTVPQVLGPVMAATVVSVAGGYTGLYLAASLSTGLGAVLVWRIRSVR